MMQIVRRVSHKLNPDMQLEVSSILSRFRDILTAAIDRASQLSVFTSKQPTRTQAMAFALYGKKDLDELVDKASVWQSDMLKRMLVIGFSHPEVLTELIPSLRPNPTPTARVRMHELPCLPVKEAFLEIPPPRDVVQLPNSSVYRSTSQPNILVEYRTYDRYIISESFNELRDNVYGLVRMLKSADSRLMSILKCSGAYHTSSDIGGRFELQYSIPSELDHPRSLRDLLVTGSTPPLHPLNHRFRLANHLATSVLYMHSGQFVHKTIKPENILIMSSVNSSPGEQFPYVLGWPFLVGFDRCRPASGLSGRYGEGKMEDCVYQHPTRWGVVAEEAFTMLHDIYSLGVVLLEVGLWEPLVRLNNVTRVYEFAPFLSDIVEGTMLRSDRRAGLLKVRLVELAERRLPPLMGEAYTRVVVACLEVLEGGMVKLDDFEKPNDELVGTAYIKYVVRRLENLKV